MEYFLKNKNSPLVLILAGVLAIAIFPPAKFMISYAGIDGSTPLAYLIIFLITFYLFAKEEQRKTSIFLMLNLIGTGILLGIVWCLIFPRISGVVFPDTKELHVASFFWGYLNVVVAAPLFEEKIARGIVFDGIAQKVGNLLSSLIVSFFFALAHTNSMIWAFLISVVLCWMKCELHLNTFYRAITHGTINAFIMTWYLTGGFWGYLL